MKKQFKKTAALLLSLALILTLLPSFKISAYGPSEEERTKGYIFIDEFDVSDKVHDPDSDVRLVWLAAEDPETGQAIIHVTGKGLIDREKWRAAARAVSDLNFDGNFEYWRGVEDFGLSFGPDIRFPANSSSLLAGFDGPIYFAEKWESSIDDFTRLQCMSQVVDASYMFLDTAGFKRSVAFDISNVSDIQLMFKGSSVNSVRLFNNSQNSIEASQAFADADNLKYLEFNGLANNVEFGGLKYDYVMRNQTEGTQTSFDAHSSGSLQPGNHYIMFRHSKSTEGLYPLTKPPYSIVARFNSDKSELQIFGEGTISLSYWRNLAASIHDVDIPKVGNTWLVDVEQDYDIRFLSGCNIAFPEESGAFFAQFDGKIIFDSMPDTSQVKNMDSMFLNTPSLDFKDGLTFNTDNVTNMESMFETNVEEKIPFNSPIHFSDTSKVTSMGAMFDGRQSFNQPLDFNTQNVTEMSRMFCDASSFNQPVPFDTAKVEQMISMFEGASSFNQPIKFDTSRVKSIKSFMSGTSSYHYTLDLDLSSCADMGRLAENSGVEEIKLTGQQQDIATWLAFDGTQSLKKLEVKGINNCELRAFAGDFIIHDLTSDTKEYHAIDELDQDTFALPNQSHTKVYLATEEAGGALIKLDTPNQIDVDAGAAYSADDLDYKKAMVYDKEIAGTWQLSDSGITEPGQHDVQLVFTANESKYGTASKTITINIKPVKPVEKPQNEKSIYNDVEVTDKYYPISAQDKALIVR